LPEIAHVASSHVCVEIAANRAREKPQEHNANRKTYIFNGIGH